MEEKETLYIPQGLKTRSELFDGYGKEELFKTIIVAIIVGIIDILIYIFTKNTAICVVFFIVNCWCRNDAYKGHNKYFCNRSSKVHD